MQRVFAGQPIRANTINTMMHALESINLLPPGSFSPAASRQYLYPTLPAFAVTMVNGKAYVSNGAVYVDGRPIPGDTLGTLGGSITGYEASRFGESGAVYVAVEYNTKPRTTSVESNPAAPTSGIENPAEGIARLVWEPPTRPADSPYERFYSLKLAEIVEDNGNRFARIYHRGNIFITGDGENTAHGESVPLAQYLASMPDIPGKIAGIQRIPVADWILQGTTSVTGAWTGPTSGIESIVDGVIYLKEPREYVAANFNNSLVQDNIGLIASVVFDQPRGTATIADGVMHLPSSVETPPAQFRPATFNASPQNSTCVMGSVQSMTATSSVDGIPRMIDGNIYLPAANFNSTDHGTTPGYINGIAFTSGVEAPFIHEGFIYLPKPTASSDYPFGLYLSSGATVDLNQCSESTLYRLSSHDQQRSANAAVLASATYAQVTHGAHASYLRIFTLTCNEYVDSAAGLDSIAQGLTGTSSIHT